MLPEGAAEDVSLQQQSSASLSSPGRGRGARELGRGAVGVGEGRPVLEDRGLLARGSAVDLLAVPSGRAAGRGGSDLRLPALRIC